MRTPDPSRVAQRYFKISSDTDDGVRLDNTTKAKITFALARAGLDGSRSFRTLKDAISVVKEVLGKFGIVVWDSVIPTSELKKPQGEVELDLDKLTPEGPHEQTMILGAGLVFQWYTLENGKFEVVVYFS